MTSIAIGQVIQQAIKTLSLNDIEEAHLEAELLTSHVLGFSRTELFIHLENTLSPKQTEEIDQLIQRRLNHEPIAYILGHREFFGLEFYVNSDTLIPRPETELLVEKALDLTSNYHPPIHSIADIGTGCGAIAIALAVHLPQVEVYAIDISAPALEVAVVNCQRHKVADHIHLLQGDLLEPLTESVDLIVANLPYVSDHALVALSDEIRLFEPARALAGGSLSRYPKPMA